MAGKKKKKEGKGKKDGEGGLPPPPNLDQTREGAAEALLSFQIRGREEAICLYEEEAETYKQKNDYQNERNYHLKTQQTEAYKTLVKGARELQEGIDQTEVVEGGKIDAELKEMFELEKRFESQEKELGIGIKAVDEAYEAVREEVERWKCYRDETRGIRSEHITQIIEKMESIKIEEKLLKDVLSKEFKKAKLKADKKFSSLEEKERQKGVEHARENLDKETRSEHTDNTWLKRQIAVMERMVEELRKEVDTLERRNIKFISTISEAQSREIQAMSELYNMSTGRGLRSKQAGESGLPSLVDVTKCTSDQSGGQVGRHEMQLLSVQGSRPPLHLTPDTVHLPPIEQQRSCHTALPPSTNWPISNTMLSSVLGVE